MLFYRSCLWLAPALIISFAMYCAPLAKPDCARCSVCTQLDLFNRKCLNFEQVKNCARLGAADAKQCPLARHPLSANGQLARAFEEIDELSRYAKAAKAKIDTLEMVRAGLTRALAASNDRGTELSDRLEEMETLVFKQAAVAKSAANTKELVELRKTVRRLETDIFALEGQVVRKDGQIERLKRSSAAVMPSPSKRVKRR